MQKFLYVFFAFLVVIVLDLWLMRWLRGYLQRKGKIPSDTSQGVYLFGAYSPFLSWIKARLPNSVSLPKIEKGDDRQDKNHTQEPSITTRIHLADNLQNESVPHPGNSIFTWLSKLNAFFSGGHGVVIELLILALGVIFYCQGILNIKPGQQLPGNETQLFQATDFILIDSITRYHQFPLWNPYIHTGLPYAGDPMLHIYNPFITVPIFLFGVIDGFRIAVFLSFLIGALGMWWLGSVLGIGKLTRVWVALMYTFAGQPVARFFQGEYLLIFGFAWIPWIVGSLIKVVETRRKLYIGLTVFSLALLFFCGNAYYSLLIMFVLLLFGLVTLPSFHKQKPWIKIDTGLLGIFILIGSLTLGFIAIQLFPQVEFWPRMNKGIDIQGSHSIGQIFLDYTSRDTFREDAFSKLPAREEFYAYIGLAPFIALAALPFGIAKRGKKPILIFILLLLLVVVWINLDWMPWKNFIYQTKIISQFRHLLRMLIFGSFAIILLGGMGMDSLWKLISQKSFDDHQLKQPGFFAWISLVGLAILVVFMVAGVWDIFKTNRQYVNTEQDYLDAYQVLGWVRQYDEGEYYVRHNPTNGWLYPMLSSHLRFIDAWYHWSDIRDLGRQTNIRFLQAEPNYIVQSQDEKPPVEGGAELIQQIKGYNIYHLSKSLPLVFLVKNDTLIEQNNPEWIRSQDVTGLTPYFPGPNGVEVIAEAKAGESLVVLVTNYPGWRVRVDGQPASLMNVSGYLAVKSLPGVHHYDFTYRPVSFYAGLVVSLICGVITLIFIVQDSQAERRRLRETIREGFTSLSRLKWLPAKPAAEYPIETNAVHQEGVFKPDTPLGLAEGARVHLVVETSAEDISLRQAALQRWLWSTRRLVTTVVSTISLEQNLFIIGVVAYLTIRLIGLVDYPIYFFTDEAIQTVSAADLVRDHFQSPEKVFLPTYFKNGQYYNLSLSVYVQVLPYLLFGKSVFVTRLTSVFITLLAVISVGLALKYIFKMKYWWAGVFLLSAIPAWFLHSRTAFETVIFVSCYAGFLYAYMLYRNVSPRYVYLAALLACLSFYAYSPGQVVIGLTGVCLLISDLRYHWQQRRWLLPGGLLLIILSIPYIRFLSLQTSAPLEHLRNLGSYWTQPIPLGEKIGDYLRQYLYGLNPAYWFIPNEFDLQRHLMKGYGHLSWLTLPFVLIGLVITIRNFRQSQYRTLMISLLVAPAGSALVGIGITRVLVFVIPVSLLMAIGLSELLTWVGNPLNFKKIIHVLRLKVVLGDYKISSRSIHLMLFFVLLAANLLMLRDALVNGPTWFQDYGMYGLQYGARQIFGSFVPTYLAENPQNKMYISSDWANGSDVFPRFFLTPEQQGRISMGSIDSFLSNKMDLDSSTIFVLTPEEFNHVVQSGKMDVLNIEKIIPYPNGEAGFYVVHLAYVNNVDTIFAQELETRRKPVEETITLNGQDVVMRYSKIDSGQLADIFDDNPYTLIRGLDANPFIIDMEFSTPRQINGLSADFGSMEFQLTVWLYLNGSSEPVKYVQTYKGLPNDPHIELMFDQLYSMVDKIHIEILNLNEGDEAKIHIRELHLLP
jgi:4-amino-4-deoxy-L-arabinose transferase-like glycosyltransferase